jgi:succinate dehydrogenase/fumarate reductase flavoprotein subunit
MARNVPNVLNIGTEKVPVVTASTIIVGAGAAGMGCAVQLVRSWRRRSVKDAASRVLVVTGGLALGASRMSGSDKQTYYKMGTSPRVPDTAEDFAKTLTAFGACHGDTALAEGIGSLRGFYNLVEAGVPFPHDGDGAFIGYKTDHDPYERATSAGPKTSFFMSRCLQAEAERMGVTIIDGCPVIEFITEGEGEARRIVGMLCFDLSKSPTSAKTQATKDLRLKLFVADNWVLAAGGPGELFESSVYPRGQFGIHGPALLAGVEACNLTESQFGLASTKFRWNVSGTYMQVIPRIFSTDPSGSDEREFLTEYFPDMPSMATNIFLKGYQWPFDAQRITGHKSSLVDMAVHQETVVRGRRVWMDFLRNPVGKGGWEEFSIDRLAPEALDYLRKTGATQGRPIERLAHMNTPAIEIYAEHKIDLAAEPLEIAICAQHNNGGFSVNHWWESNLKHTFVIGEMAGTHGVKRPGGSALNAGQVGAVRAAEYIANVYGAEPPRIAKLGSALKAGAASAIGTLRAMLEQSKSAHVKPPEALAEIGRRMTRFGAHIRWAAGVQEAIAEGLEQYAALREEGLKLASPRQLPEAVRAMQQCLTHLAFLAAIRGIIQRGGGSRGSHCVLDEGGVEMHPGLIDPAGGRPYRFKPENEALRDHVLCVRYSAEAADLFDLRDEKPRPIPRRSVAFETAWGEYREGKVFEA